MTENGAPDDFRIPDPPRTWTCNVAGCEAYVFSRKDKLIKHWQTIHTPIYVQYSCPTVKCAAVFASHKAAITHINKVHKFSVRDVTAINNITIPQSVVPNFKYVDPVNVKPPASYTVPTAQPKAPRVGVKFLDSVHPYWRKVGKETPLMRTVPNDEELEPIIEQQKPHPTEEESNRIVKLNPPFAPTQEPDVPEKVTPPTSAQVVENESMLTEPLQFSTNDKRHGKARLTADTLPEDSCSLRKIIYEAQHWTNYWSKLGSEASLKLDEVNQRRRKDLADRLKVLEAENRPMKAQMPSTGHF